MTVFDRLERKHIRWMEDQLFGHDSVHNNIMYVVVGEFGCYGYEILD